MLAVDTVGSEWLAGVVGDWTEEISHVLPSVFNEEYRYLPESVTSKPGFIRFNRNPYMIEILDACDVNSPVREINLMKGVQITYTTLLESIMLYVMCRIKTVPMMYLTADKGLAKGRVENNIIPMLEQSGFADIIRSSDIGNNQKTGKNASQIQWEGGGYLRPDGAKNADTMRQWSIMYMLKDEIDAWLDKVGKDGCPDKLTDARCDGYFDVRKIIRGSTPLLMGSSKIFKAYKLGDRREYRVLCRHCSFPQKLRWSGTNKETGKDFGFSWFLEHGLLVPESVRYNCQNCGMGHAERDKKRLFSLEHGAHWHPTTRPSKPNVRSYHLPGMYSPIGMKPWHGAVSDYLEAYDPLEKRVKDMHEYQVFYNNILGWPFEIRGSKITFETVSAHRRTCYSYGQIPNKHAEEFAGSKVLFLNCKVDLHKHDIRVSVWGICRDARMYLIEYHKWEDEHKDGCLRDESPVWGQLRKLIEEKEYTADDGRRYSIVRTFIDSSFENSRVVSFCATFDPTQHSVYPILGRDRPGKNQKIKEFDTFVTQQGTTGLLLTVDYYKDRMAPVMRREWKEDAGEQGKYHLNMPMDATDDQVKELTKETRKKKRDATTGKEWFYWHRPDGAHNHLWDCVIYSQASIEVLARDICIDHFGEEKVKWPEVWDLLEENYFEFWREKE